MADADVPAVFRVEHDAFASLVAGLSEDQWNQQSLCPDWTVRDVVTHAAFHIHRDGFRETYGSSEKYLAILRDRNHADTTEGLVAWFASPAAPAAVRSTLNLCEVVIHHQDVGRPLDEGRQYPEAALRLCLDFCTTVRGNIFVIARKKRLARNLRIIATDMSWTKGDGPEVRGPAEAILMTIAGRRAALADLDGEGVDTIAERFETEPAVG